MTDAPPDDAPFDDEPPSDIAPATRPGPRPGGRTPPHNIDAERALLGALLLSGEAIRDVAGSIQPGDFYRPAHQHILGVAFDLHGRGVHVESISVADELRRQGHLDEVGGTGALVELQTAAIGTANATHWAKIVRDHSTLRRLISAGSAIQDLAYNAPDNVADAVDRAGTLIAEATKGALAEEEDLFQLSTFLHTRAVERPPWVIPGIIRRRWRIMLVAPEGLGKTMLMRGLATSVSQGLHPFTGERVPPMTVMMADFENPDDVIIQQCLPIERAMRRSGAIGHRFNADRVWLYHREEGINIRSRTDFARFESAVEAVRPDLLCIGPLYKLFRKQGDSDEEATLEVINALDDIRRRYDVAMIIEHHAGKPQGGTRNMDPFGSSLWFRWPELGLTMVPTKSDSEVDRRRFRRPRVRHLWPDQLYRMEPGAMMPWKGGWKRGGPGADGFILPVVRRLDAELDELYGIEREPDEAPANLFERAATDPDENF